MKFQVFPDSIEAANEIRLKVLRKYESKFPWLIVDPKSSYCLSCRFCRKSMHPTKYSIENHESKKMHTRNVSLDYFYYFFRFLEIFTL